MVDPLATKHSILKVPFGALLLLGFCFRTRVARSCPTSLEGPGGVRCADVYPRVAISMWTSLQLVFPWQILSALLLLPSRFASLQSSSLSIAAHVLLLLCMLLHLDFL